MIQETGTTFYCFLAGFWIPCLW